VKGVDNAALKRVLVPTHLSKFVWWKNFARTTGETVLLYTKDELKEFAGLDGVALFNLLHMKPVPGVSVSVSVSVCVRVCVCVSVSKIHLLSLRFLLAVVALLWLLPLVALLSRLACRIRYANANGSARVCSGCVFCCCALALAVLLPAGRARVS
jgi:hypothetical protein